MGDTAYHYFTTKAPALSRNVPASDSYKKIKKVTVKKKSQMVW